MCKTISLKVSWGGEEQSGGNPIERGGGMIWKKEGGRGIPEAEIQKNYALLQNILQFKKCKEVEATKG